MVAGVNRPGHEADHSPPYRASLIKLLCGGKLGQNIVCMRATWNSVHGLQNELDIQGDSGGICTTLGNDSMSDSKQKSS